MTTSHPNVKVTVYMCPGKTLISIGNFDAEEHAVRLSFDWNRLGVNPSKATLRTPEIQNFQHEQTFRPDEPIPVKSKEGWLLILSDGER